MPGSVSTKTRGLLSQASCGRLTPTDRHSGQHHGGYGTRFGGRLGSQASLLGEQGIT